MKIARFVDLAACRSIFSDNSTFVLRSEKHYQKQCETDRGDEQELVRESACHSAEYSNVLISCWTILDGKEPTEAEWSLFENSVVAIISTPTNVCRFLEGAFELDQAEQKGPTLLRLMKSAWACVKRLGRHEHRDNRRFPFMFLDHKAVRYDQEDVEITTDNIWSETVFVKRPLFKDQKEYRFALPFSGGLPHYIETYIFSRDPFEYLETCYANPAMCKKQRRNLAEILLRAVAGYEHFRDKNIPDFFANEDFVFQGA